MISEAKTTSRPEILAPAGNKDAFLAALAAGADAIYCGLKSYSARMEAKNFTPGQLAALTRLAHRLGTRVYVTLNALLKPADLEPAGELLVRLQREVHPDALIIQDPAVIPLARQAGYSGEIHLSTLTHVSLPAALGLIRQLEGVTRVVLPRELSVDEIKRMAGACPADFGLEVFIHGALCYGVSGRCYWSSWLGGKSGLRGRCVQPCRRMYTQGSASRRYFSCQDLSLDVLCKVLRSIPQVTGWKIEGRKKGPHYVYYTVTAYRLLRDMQDDPDTKSTAKKTALGLLAQALGRPATHYHFLPQRPQPPVDVTTQTGSGLFAGKVQGSPRQAYIRPRFGLLPGDSLRIGYEDEPGHTLKRVGRYVPPKGRLSFGAVSGRGLVRGAPVFLTDRREKALAERLEELDRRLAAVEEQPSGPVRFHLRLPAKSRRRPKAVDMQVLRRIDRSAEACGVWLSPDALARVPDGAWQRTWWWLPPTAWPDNQDALKTLIDTAAARGGRYFVLNTPWQRALFDSTQSLRLYAGPFCNLTNPLAIGVMADLGFSGAFVSPELSFSDYEELPAHSPLPLGIVIGGNWPLCIARTLSADIREDQPFSSPRGEQAWVHRWDADYWMYPNWPLDLSAEKKDLQRAGYCVFAHLVEPIPPGVKMKQRPGEWNWRIGLR
jgi:putative protease